MAFFASAGPARADGRGTARHLLAGVHAFKDARYEEALVELRVVEHAPDAPDDLAFYLGPTLYKLGRYREALDVFVTSTAHRDALTELYLGQTYYQLGLYRKARELFSALHARGLGPVLEAAVVRYVAAIDTVYATPPSPRTVDAYATEGLELAAAGDPITAGELLDEAAQVEALAAAPHRHAEIVAALAAAWTDAKRPQAAIERLTHESTLSDDEQWQLARAYVAAGDLAHARPLLDRIVRGNGPNAARATALLAGGARRP